MALLARFTTRSCAWTRRVNFSDLLSATQILIQLAGHEVAETGIAMFVDRAVEYAPECPQKVEIRGSGHLFEKNVRPDGARLRSQPTCLAEAVEHHRHILGFDLNANAVAPGTERRHSCRASPGKGVEDSVAGK